VNTTRHPQLVAATCFHNFAADGRNSLKIRLETIGRKVFKEFQIEPSKTFVEAKFSACKWVVRQLQIWLTGFMSITGNDFLQFQI